ncbi:uncharacterized protein, linocin/CFP29 [Sphaerochaeta pleomorpha str. Grapes]|uniref:Uncharacterized protein, linocin/CFP29 n=1 Tax=Sphaerochaeta pleomorpha (strain ATCC BAA-1885 / DSM 22778 / Grapes) TaxID=158190 RepID=G8QSM2_SPHPG|nr:family 1 encapsulin nanocompartment shell protein [Sphaerochaeta pleomorpha]AEV28983.1 uncharacterized protein, linocin/CFP29 [Sphaerochaeta pleomorpha str. Grapes]
MDMFKRELAPLSLQGWKEIENRAKEILLTHLTARKVVKVLGPKGIDYTAVSEGRLKLCDDGEVKAGFYMVKPLVEARVQFSLNRWEIDNLDRGAKDIDFGGLDKAIANLAEFEEKALFEGYELGGIKGLRQASTNKTLVLGNTAQETLAALTEGIIILKQHFATSPYALIVGTKTWISLHKDVAGLPLIERVERLLGGKVVHALTLEGALLIPFDDPSIEMTIGQDFALGYEMHDSKEVRLFATESFTFRVLDPKRIVPYKA